MNCNGKEMRRFFLIQVAIILGFFLIGTPFFYIIRKHTINKALTVNEKLYQTLKNGQLDNLTKKSLVGLEVAQVLKARQEKFGNVSSYQIKKTYSGHWGVPVIIEMHVQRERGDSEETLYFYDGVCLKIDINNYDRKTSWF